MYIELSLGDPTAAADQLPPTAALTVFFFFSLFWSNQPVCFRPCLRSLWRRHSIILPFNGKLFVTSGVFLISANCFSERGPEKVPGETSDIWMNGFNYAANE